VSDQLYVRNIIHIQSTKLYLGVHNELTGSVEQMMSYKEIYNLPGILEISSLL